MRILLIRHAEPDYSIDSLTPKGHAEARFLAERMSHYTIRDFYVSPLGRAQKTAEYSLKKMGREAETLDWLREFKGQLTDPETGELRLAWDLPPRYWNSLQGVYDAETWTTDPRLEKGTVREVWKQTREGVDELLGRYGYRKEGPVWICKENNADTIALFCHFGIAMTVVGYLTGISPMVLWHRCQMMPSSVTELVTEERVKGEVSFRMTRMGDITHLEGNGEPGSTAGLFPLNYTGVDSTDILKNGTKGWIR